MAVSISVNGQVHQSDAAPDTPLLYVLRNDLGLNGAKYGCGVSQCGACTVIIDGKATRSCVTALSETGGRRITTLGGTVRLLRQRHDHDGQDLSRPQPEPQ